MCQFSAFLVSHLSHLSHHELFQFPSNRLQLLRLYSWICGFSHSLIVPRWSKSEYVLFSYIVLFVFVGSPGLKHAIYGSKMIWKRTYVPTSRIEQIKVIPLGLQLLPVDSIDSPGRLGWQPEPKWPTVAGWPVTTATMLGKRSTKSLSWRKQFG
jgi:hypothetical protein